MLCLVKYFSVVILHLFCVCAVDVAVTNRCILSMHLRGICHCPYWTVVAVFFAMMLWSWLLPIYYIFTSIGMQNRSEGFFLIYMWDSERKFSSFFYDSNLDFIHILWMSQLTLLCYVYFGAGCVDWRFYYTFFILEMIQCVHSYIFELHSNTKIILTVCLFLVVMVLKSLFGVHLENVQFIYSKRCLLD